MAKPHHWVEEKNVKIQVIVIFFNIIVYLVYLFE